jgi:hypothetical protein
MHLICDIDGVLITFPDKDGSIPTSHSRDHVTPTGHDQPVTIWLNPAHGPLLNELIADTGLDPLWCTSWRADATTLIGSRLGLRPWPHVDLPQLLLTTSHPHGYLWKRDHVAPYINDKPCAWIDDDFTPADHDWAAARTATGNRKNRTGRTRCHSARGNGAPWKGAASRAALSTPCSLHRARRP